MGADNNDNLAWNTAHNGKRCPMNDTDVDGFPIALPGNIASWKDGSMNNSVNETALINSVIVSDADVTNLIADILTLNNYTVANMKYGYKGDARDKVSGDGMSFRAYPTGMLTKIWDKEAFCYDCDNWNLDGSLGSTNGDWLHLRASGKLNFKLPYDVYFDVLFETVGYEMLISAGSLEPNAYRLVGATAWINLPQNAMFFSVVLPTVDTTYILTGGGLKPNVVPALSPEAPWYNNGTQKVDGTVLTNGELLVTAAEVAYPCGDPVYAFNYDVAINGINLCNTIADVYNNPATANRLFENSSLQGNKLGMAYGTWGTVGSNVAFGDMQTDGNGCTESVYNREAAASTYYYTYTVIPDGGTTYYRIEWIVKTDASGNYEGEVIPTGPYTVDC